VIIGHVGAGGAGKSTLAKELAGVLDLDYKPSVVREVFNEFGWNEKDQRNATPEACWKLQKKIFERKLYQDHYLGKDVVFDRTPIDHLAYVIYRCELALTEERLKDIEHRAEEEIKKYDVVVYHPIPSWNAEEDGMREDDYSYRRIIDVIMLGYLNSFEVGFVIVPDADVKVQRDSLYTYIQGLDEVQSPPGELSVPVREGAHPLLEGRVLLRNQEREASSSSQASPVQPRLEGRDGGG